MNTFMNGLKTATNYGYTENGAIKNLSTLNPVLDMFAQGAAYRNRDDEDCILLFSKAFAADPTLALRCLFYIRDIRGGQGERRYFRVCMNWLAKNKSEIAEKMIEFIPEYGRYDDLYCLVNTPIESSMFNFIKRQIKADIASYNSGENVSVSLLAKWLKSCNTSSKESRELGDKTRKALGLTQREYRKTLSKLRERINVLERLMSANRFDEIEFDKIPSKAGFIYRNAFARKDVTAARYAAFMNSKTTKVNAGTLYPYEVVDKAIQYGRYYNSDSVERNVINKYWDNLADYIKGASFNGIAVVDTSGSMHGTPMDVAISLGLYCAEKNSGPFANHYISFSSRPQLIETIGVDFVDKVKRIYSTNLCENTNIEAVFSLLLETAIINNCAQEDIPQNIIIISDQEFDAAANGSYSWISRKERFQSWNTKNAETLFDGIMKKWKQAGYNCPKIIFWNVDARSQNIPVLGDNISYVSGFSPSIFQQILTGKTGTDLMLETLNSERYSQIIV